jgi:hypothetical protein
MLDSTKKQIQLTVCLHARKCSPLLIRLVQTLVHTKGKHSNKVLFFHSRTDRLNIKGKLKKNFSRVFEENVKNQNNFLIFLQRLVEMVFRLRLKWLF